VPHTGLPPGARFSLPPEHPPGSGVGEPPGLWEARSGAASSAPWGEHVTAKGGGHNAATGQDGVQGGRAPMPAGPELSAHWQKVGGSCMLCAVLHCRTAGCGGHHKMR
jgi:hypothetical protein